MEGLRAQGSIRHRVPKWMSFICCLEVGNRARDHQAHAARCRVSCGDAVPCSILRDVIMDAILASSTDTVAF